MKFKVKSKVIYDLHAEMHSLPPVIILEGEPMGGDFCGKHEMYKDHCKLWQDNGKLDSCEKPHKAWVSPLEETQQEVRE